MSKVSIKKDLINKFEKMGKDRFDRFLITYSLNKLISIQDKTYTGSSPDIELINYYDKCISLYRSENKEIYLDMAHSFRKIAHKIYRIALKKGLTEKNFKFLNAV